MREDLTRYVDVAIATAYEAGRLTLGYFGTGLRPDFKEDDTPVTVADREAEALIRRRLAAAFPDHGLLGEEYGEEREGSSHRWLIDPIDGTKSFVRGVPLYGVLLGLEIEGRVEVGVACFPALDELVAAASGHGCRLNGRPCRVADTAELRRAVVSFTDAASFEAHGRAEAWARVMAATGQRVGWSDAYGHMLVATGRCELMLDPVLNPWDAGPFPVILREAGGYFGDWSGRERLDGGEGLSTTARLKDEVLRLIEGPG